MSLSVIVVIAFTTIFVLITLSSTILYIYYFKRRMAKTQGKLVTIRHFLYYQIEELPSFKSSSTKKARNKVIHFSICHQKTGKLLRKVPCFTYTTMRDVSKT